MDATGSINLQTFRKPNVIFLNTKNPWRKKRSKKIFLFVSTLIQKANGCKFSVLMRLKVCRLFVGFVEWKPTLWEFCIQRNIKLAWDKIQRANAHFTFYSKCSKNSFPEKHETSMMQDIYIATTNPTRNLIDSHNTATDLLSSVSTNQSPKTFMLYNIYLSTPN